MKKIMLAGLALVGMSACDSNDSSTTMESEKDNKVVVERDSVATEYEVTETVVEYDTTKRVKTVDADVNKKDHR
jgi:hypothetical protein